MNLSYRGRLRLSQAGSLIAGLLVCVLLTGAWGASCARADAFSWSNPTVLDRTGHGQNPSAMACPSAGQCTAVDIDGEEVTFDPVSPGTTDPVLIDPGAALELVSCVSTTQCVAVDSTGDAFTFDPNAPGTPSAVPVDPGAAPSALACTASGQCTLVDSGGDEVTFTAGAQTASPPPAALTRSGDELEGLDCPTAAQCTTIDAATGDELTFDPQNPGSSTDAQVDSVAGSPEAISSGGLACASASQCTLAAVGGYVASFDPEATATVTPRRIDSSSENTFQSVSCTSDRCTAVDQGGDELTFNPATISTASRPTPQLIDSGAEPVTVTCVADTQCAAVDDIGDEVAFDPSHQSLTVTSALVTVDPNGVLVGVACPSSTECAAVDSTGDEFTVDPASPGTVTPDEVDGAAGRLTGIACPSTAQCTAISPGGDAVTFDPADVSSPAASVASVDPSGGLTALACPSTAQCTAVDDVGDAVSFDPADVSSSAASVASVDPSGGLTALACPSTAQCTAVDDVGDAVSFDPADVSSSAASVASVDPSGGLTALACPSTAQCTAVDHAGDEVTFDPAAPGTPSLGDLGTGAGLGAVSCASATQCTAVNRLGEELTFDPAAPATTPVVISGADSLEAITCPSTLQCVAVDDIGDAFVGTAPAPTAPTTTTVTSQTPAPAPAPVITTTSPAPAVVLSAPKRAPGAVSSRSISSATATRVSTAIEDGTTVTATGIGALTVSRFAEDPGRATSFPASGQFVELQVAAGSRFSSLTVTDCDLDAATQLHWLDGNRWRVVSGQSERGRCIEVTLGAHSSPSSAQLTAAVFAPGYVTTVTAPARLRGDGARVAVSVRCDAREHPKGLRCPVQLSLSTIETVGHVRRVRILASRRITVTAGRRAQVTLQLDDRGRRLLARDPELTVHYEVALGVSAVGGRIIRLHRR